MSTSLDQRMCRYLFEHYFWVNLWECFWMGLAFESVDWIQVDDPPQCGWALSVQSVEDLNRTKVGGRRNLSLLSASLRELEFLILFYPSAPLFLKTSDSDWITPLAFLDPACSWQILGLFSLCNCMNQLLLINFLYILLVLFLWRTQANKVHEV